MGGFLTVRFGVVAVTSLLLSSSAPYALTQDRPALVGAISGTIIDANSGSPLHGAFVSLYSLGQPRITFPSVLTDVQGRFVFTPLPANRAYFVRAAKSGYADGVFSRTGQPNELGDQVGLRPGEWRKTQIALERFGSIQGRVSGPLGPIVDATVLAVSPVEIGGDVRWASTTFSSRTDERGVYSLMLPAGKYRILVPAAPLNADTLEALVSGNRITLPLPKTQKPIVFNNGYYPSGETLDTGATIKIAAGEHHIDADIALRSGEGFQVKGTLAGMRPDANRAIVVRLLPVDEVGLAASAIAATTPSTDASFTFSRIPAGAYRLEASTSRSALELGRAASSSVRSSPPPLFGPRPTGSSARLTLSSSPSTVLDYVTIGDSEYGAYGTLNLVVDRDIPDVELHLQGTKSIRFRVRWEGTKPDALPRDWIAVEPDAVSSELSFRHVVPDGDSYVVNGLRPGQYFVKLTRPFPFVIKSVECRGEDITFRPLSLSADLDSEVDVLVTITSSSAQVRGHVAGLRTDDGAVALIYFPTDSLEREQFGLTPHRSGAIGIENGQFEISALPAGEYFFAAAILPDRLSLYRPAFLRSLEPRAIRVSVDWGSVVQVEVPFRR